MPENPLAFPQPLIDYVGAIYSSNDYGQSGMTLRDWFAGQALVGVINQSTIAEVAATIMKVAAANGVNEHDVMARAAYRYADAMLATREKGGA